MQKLSLKRSHFEVFCILSLYAKWIGGIKDSPVVEDVSSFCDVQTPKEKGHSCGLIFSGHLFVPVFKSIFIF